MTFQGFKLVDLCLEDSKEYYRDLTSFLFNTVRNDSHPNRNLYLNIHNELNDYLCFLLIYDDQNQVVGFEGIWNPGTYKKSVARIFNRKYFSEKIRSQEIVTEKYLNNSITLNLTLPYKIKRAQDLDLKNIFFSFSEDRRRRSYKRIVDLFNDKFQGEVDFELLEGKYFTGSPALLSERNSETIKNCWQNIVWGRFENGTEVSLPKLGLGCGVE